MVNRCLGRDRTDRQHRKLWKLEEKCENMAYLMCIMNNTHTHYKHVCVSNLVSKYLHCIAMDRSHLWTFNKDIWHSFCFDFWGEIFSIALHYSRAPGPLAGRSPIANINNQSWKPGARHHSNPKCIWQQNRAETGHSGNSSSNQSKGFQTGKSVRNNYYSLEGKAI